MDMRSREPSPITSLTAAAKDVFATGLKIERCGAFIRLIFTSDKRQVVAQVVMPTDTEVPTDPVPSRAH